MHPTSTLFLRSGRFALLAATVAMAALLAGCASAPSTPAASGAKPAESRKIAPAVPGQAAPDDAAIEQRFAKWVADFRATARAQGIGEATLRSAFDQVQYLPRVIELDRAQPEFTRTVWDYLDNARKVLDLVERASQRRLADALRTCACCRFRRLRA